MGNNEGWLYVTFLWGTVGNCSFFHIPFIFPSPLCSLYFSTHTYIHLLPLWCFIQGQLNISCLQVFLVLESCGFALSFFITWYSKSDRDSLMDLLILGQMPDAILEYHIFSLPFQVGILFINRSNLWSPASSWVSSHTHVLLHSTRCMFAYVTHALLKDSRLSHVFHTLNLP